MLSNDDIDDDLANYKGLLANSSLKNPSTFANRYGFTEYRPRPNVRVVTRSTSDAFLSAAAAAAAGYSVVR